MTKTLVWNTVWISLTCIGCTVGPNYCPPETEIPLEWNSPLSAGMSNDCDGCFNWIEALNDPTLDSLVERALQNNLDIYIACTRLLEVRLQRKGKMADLYPHIDGSMMGGHFHANRKAILDEVIGNTSSKNNIDVNFFEIGFDACWEIDLFGRTKRELNALKAQIEATEEMLNSVSLTLTAEVARYYIELRGAQQRLSLLLRNIDAQRNIVSLTSTLIDIGTLDEFNLQEAMQALLNLEAQVPAVKLSIDQTIHHLSILIGVFPGALFEELCLPNRLPCLPYDKPICLPSGLLRQRPDIRKSERELAAATEKIGAAVAALFPRISLVGFIGDINHHLPSLFTSPSETWLAGPQLLWPLLNSKLLQEDVKFNQVKTQEALYEYQKTVLLALEEAENAIASLHYEMQRHQKLEEAKNLGRESYELIYDLYQKGMRDYLQVEALHRTFLSTEEALLQSQIELLLNYIALYKAMGG